MSATALLVDATVVMFAALAGARFARRTSASLRHLLLASGFGMLLILPIASVAAPKIRVAVPVAARAIAGARTGDAPGDATPFGDVGPSAESGAPSRSPGWTHPSVSWLLFLWIAGAAATLLPVVTGVWQVRRLRRTARPWRAGQAVLESITAAAHLRRPIHVRLNQRVPGPMTCGVLHPTILLPPEAQGWAPEDLRRALVHELEHVRRADWLIHCVARVVAAGYWFHPIVWIAWRQLTLEAERACDDAVLLTPSGVVSRPGAPLTSGDLATAYADQLVDAARRRSTTARPLQLAMADRRDLSRRVAAVLDSGQVRGRAGVWSVAVVIAAAVAFAAGLSSLRIEAARPPSQTPASSAPVQRLTYDGATIKPCQAEEHPTGARGTAGGTNATISPGRFYVPCVTTEQLIYLAYAAYGAGPDEHLVNDDYGEASNATKVRGGPDWVHSLKDKYEIEATAAGATERTVLMGAMLRSLLEDRFHLKVHRETEDAPLDELVVAPGGLKLTPMRDGDCVPGDGNPPDPTAAKPTCGNLMMTGDQGKTAWRFGGFALSELATLLGRTLHTHVVDNTGVTDKFIFRFEFTRGQDDFATEASISAALEQLGLKLVHTKGPRGYLVIDHIERPTPDAPFDSVPPARAEGPGLAGRTARPTR